MSSKAASKRQLVHPLRAGLFRLTTMAQQYLAQLVEHLQFAQFPGTIRDNRPILLSNAERQRFITQLNAPDDPNERLKKAARYYLKEINTRGLGCRVTHSKSSSQ